MASPPVRYRMPLAYAAFFWSWLSALTVVTLFSGVLLASDVVGGSGPPVLFIVAWLIVMASVWFYGLVFVSVEARLWPDDGRLQFRSLLRSKETNVSEVVEIGWALRGLNGRLVTVRYRGGVARMPNTKSTSELARRVQESNQSVEVTHLSRAEARGRRLP